MSRAGFPEFSALPTRSPRRLGFLYVLETTDGRVKVGRTIYPRRRFRSYGRDLAGRGLRIVRYAVEQTRGCPIEAERELLARLTCRFRPCSGHTEWFRDLRFGDACTLVRQMARREVIAAYGSCGL